MNEVAWKEWEWTETFRGRDGVIFAYCPEHPWATKKGWVPEHVLVMENLIRGPIPKMAQVIHINGNKSDNRPENLTLMKVQVLMAQGTYQKKKKSGA